MRHSYVFDVNRINEDKLHEEALHRMLVDPTDQTTIHRHAHGQRCNADCYLVRPTEDARKKHV